MDLLLAYAELGLIDYINKSDVGKQIIWRTERDSSSFCAGDGLIPDEPMVCEQPNLNFGQNQFLNLHLMKLYAIES